MSVCECLCACVCVPEVLFVCAVKVWSCVLYRCCIKCVVHIFRGHICYIFMCMCVCGGVCAVKTSSCVLYDVGMLAVYAMCSTSMLYKMCLPYMACSWLYNIYL